jgi:hypothetical protein
MQQSVRVIRLEHTDPACRQSTKTYNMYQLLYMYGDRVRSESRCALRLQYVDLVQACIDAHGHYFQKLL